MDGMVHRNFGPIAHQCSTERGILEIYTPQPCVHVIVMEGFMEGPHVDELIKVTEQSFATHQAPQHSFHDWLCMMGYESRCRVRLTSWVLGNPRLFGDIHIAARERIVRMGVQVANMVLSSRMRTHGDEESLLKELDRMIRARRSEARSAV